MEPMLPACLLDDPEQAVRERNPAVRMMEAVALVRVFMLGSPLGTLGGLDCDGVTIARFGYVCPLYGRLGGDVSCWWATSCDRG